MCVKVYDRIVLRVSNADKVLKVIDAGGLGNISE